MLHGMDWSAQKSSRVERDEERIGQENCLCVTNKNS
jgi:hypothetical protein